jgi:carboxymethylenebutenolidase
MGQMIEFVRPDGGRTQGYVASAERGRPGIVVLQEWWGLNDQICGVADRFARAGYNALAPDLYKGRVTQEVDEANHLMSGLDFTQATHQDVRGAVKYLKALGPKAAVMGFCMGGALAIAALVHVPEADAGVCFYGIPDPAFADPVRITKPLQCHFANQDDWCTPAKVDALESAMKGESPRPEIFRYDARHAFFSERNPVYDVACANLAWERMTAFLNSTLR